MYNRWNKSTTYINTCAPLHYFHTLKNIPEIKNPFYFYCKNQVTIVINGQGSNNNNTNNGSLSFIETLTHIYIYTYIRTHTYTTNSNFRNL